MNVLDLFSGIGGFSLGLERAGLRTVAFCEIDPFCRRVLAKHWPGVPVYDDVRTLTADHLRADGISVDVICGGFPCQDISVAGKGAGIDGARSGLWSEYARLIGELRPRYVIVENVSALLGRGLDRVLGDLATLGLDAEWHCIPASAVGAPHRRDRLWIMAYSECGGLQTSRPPREGDDGSLCGWREHPGHLQTAPNPSSNLADALGPRLEGRASISGNIAVELEAVKRGGALLGDAIGVRELQSEGCEREQWRRPSDAGWWLSEPDVGRVAHGVPARVDRLRSLGNAVVPQIPEIIGRAIMRSALTT